MLTVSTKLVLWTSPRYSDKTITVSELAETVRKAGFRVTGLLAPSLYDNYKLI